MLRPLSDMLLYFDVILSWMNRCRHDPGCPEQDWRVQHRAGYARPGKSAFNKLPHKNRNGFINRGEEVDTPATVALTDEITPAFAGQVCEVTHNGKTHPVV